MVLIMRNNIYVITLITITLFVLSGCDIVEEEYYTNYQSTPSSTSTSNVTVVQTTTSQTNGYLQYYNGDYQGYYHYPYYYYPYYYYPYYYGGYYYPYY